jgi:lysozyme
MAHDLKSMLEREEGRVATAYPDPLTHSDPWTIGVGHTGPEVHAGLVWSDDQIDAALDSDIAKATALCEANFPWFDAVDEVRQAVIIGMAFQMGNRLLQFVNTLAAMRDGRWNDAAGGILNSAWAHQTPARAARMARQLETDQWQ